MRRSSIPLAVPLVGAVVALSACGSGGYANAPRQSVGATGQTAVQSPAGSPTSAAAARARAQAQNLLNRLPAYPGGQLVADQAYTPAAGGPPVQVPPTLGLSPAMGVPESSNLVDLYRQWQVPADPATVLTWVKQQAAAKGLHQVGSAASSGPGGVSSQGGAFAATTGAGLTPGVQVSVKANATGDTLVRYDAMVIWLPPRPKAEELPAGVTQVRIQLLDGIPQQTVASATVTASADVAKLVGLVQGLPTSAPGVTNCPADTGREVVLTFAGAGGQAVTVSQGTCGFVRFGQAGTFPTLTDPGDALWNAAATLAGRPGWGVGAEAPACRVTRPPA